MLQSISIPIAAPNERRPHARLLVMFLWVRFRASCHTGHDACQSSGGTQVQRRRRRVHAHVMAEPSLEACLVQAVQDEQWRCMSSSARLTRQQRRLGWLSHAVKCIMQLQRHGPPSVCQQHLQTCKRRSAVCSAVGSSSQVASLPQVVAWSMEIVEVIPNRQTPMGRQCCSEERPRLEADVANPPGGAESNERERISARTGTVMNKSGEAGVAMGRTNLRYAMPWYHVTCPREETQRLESRPASGVTSERSGRISRIRRINELSGRVNIKRNQRVCGYGHLKRSRGPAGALLGPGLGPQAGIATTVQCNSRSRRLSRWVSH